LLLSFVTPPEALENSQTVHTTIDTGPAVTIQPVFNAPVLTTNRVAPTLGTVPISPSAGFGPTAPTQPIGNIGGFQTIPEEVATVDDENTETSTNIRIDYDNYNKQGTAYYNDLQNTETEYLQNNSIPPEKVKDALLKEAEDANIILGDNIFDDNLLDRDTRLGDDILDNPLDRRERTRGTRIY